MKSGSLLGRNVFICEECVRLCTEAFKDLSDDPGVNRATEVIHRLR